MSWGNVGFSHRRYVIKRKLNENSNHLTCDFLPKSIKLHIFKLEYEKR